MKVSAICSALISMAVVASAIPTAAEVETVEIEARTSKTIKEADQQCSADSGHQVVSCCNTSNKKTSLGDGIGSLLGGLLNPGSCAGLNVNIRESHTASGRQLPFSFLCASSMSRG